MLKVAYTVNSNTLNIDCALFRLHFPKIHMSEICTTNARQQAKKGALFVDVREPADLATLAFDAPEVINLPLSQLARRWQELPQERELVTVCFNGVKSQQAAEFLLAHGLKNVHPMRGGILLWMQKGFPVLGKRHTTLEK
ncbi:rhodanese-like domain-containing protein [Rhodoferax sp.]|uniref:rhodanese-like domain-containing protein n=1 Tax=Rhodoferax sp. TaxID=50421 RepID=UPI00272FCB5E|nr:rhodanese-like domain-containing protein [Rhodoferax sp.]MDP1531627.1 rhodanese-like domain-containing protein [Rhodoferax sp.]MDP1944184.1 rhodanese-like domain-containing protein [Rhodoferax sp.]MDP2441162.1 rhodanese-like domain-containing protein [Rhodoferax sp.]MDP3192455.1 rhodanese-like domain-containing protein [Rhodoferax sp.]MDP3336415.1 rhodanese-like domain-containing protein [Rhodoferax sp.]